MARDRRSVDEERRRIFRRMEWTFVYAPPTLAVLVAVFGSAFLAWAVDVDGIGFWGRWAVGVLVLLVLPALVYWIRSRRDRNDDE